MTKFQHGRHTATFVLLFLAENPAYGGQLLKVLDEELPFNPIDSAILYRTLKKLKTREGAIHSYWSQEDGNKPIKWYEVTADGWKRLDEFHIDILLRQRNLSFFINQYEKLKEDSR